jgi:DNA-binding response OmpR family regulator
MSARVLLVEDDAAIGKSVSQALQTNGYDVEWVKTGHDAIGAARLRPPALVLLDLGLPDVDGIEVCGQLRDSAPYTTIVMLTARADEIDVVVGLDAGADDYVTKPFSLSELLARVRAHLRRPQVNPQSDSLTVGDLVVDVAAHRVHCGDREIELRPKEFELLALLAANAGQAVTRERIMHDVWDAHWFGSTKTLDMHISSLRHRLPADKVTITTLPRVGYRLELEPG